MGDLDVVPRQHMSPDLVAMIRTAGFSVEALEEEIRSHEFAWRSYIRGHVVSRHAKQLIVQFMAACCGRSSQNDLADNDDENQEAASKELPDSELSLQRIHAIIDGMSREGEESAVSKKVSRLAKQAK